MILLINEIELQQKQNTDAIPLECEHCHSVFYRSARWIKHTFTPARQKRNSYNYCSQKCYQASRVIKANTQQISCVQCGKPVIRCQSHLRKIKNVFCSKSCAAMYNNTHKINGSRRSKLETWLEFKLSELYPSLEILYCDKTAINAELDIYVPSLKLAFELNGIYHYEPIHGKSKLSQIRNNDYRKFQACIEHSIELVIIDASQLKYFKEHNCQKYLDIILKIISSK